MRRHWCLGCEYVISSFYQDHSYLFLLNLLTPKFACILYSMIYFDRFNYLCGDNELHWLFKRDILIARWKLLNKAPVLPSIEILKYRFSHIWFSACAIIRMSSTWPCCWNLACVAVWRDLLILKSADAHLVSRGMETEECAVCEVSAWSRVCPSVCVSRVKKKNPNTCSEHRWWLVVSVC